VNIITVISSIAVTFGALVLFVVLSAFDGLKTLHLESLSVSDPDLVIYSPKGGGFEMSDELKTILNEEEGLLEYTEILESQILLSHKQKRMNAIIKGVDQNYNKVINTDSLLAFGDWSIANKDRVVVGVSISNKLGIGIYNYENLLRLYVPKPGKGIITNPIQAFNSKNVVVSGFYQLNDNIDNKYVFSDISVARELLGKSKTNVSQIAIKFKKNSESVESFKKRITKKFNLVVENRLESNYAIYKMLNTERLIAYLLCILVLIIAFFNVVGSLIMMVSDKKDNLMTLFNIGLSLKKIRAIFFNIGLFITLISAVVGITLGYVIILLQQQYELVMITSYLAYPTQILLINFIVVFLSISGLGVIASLFVCMNIRMKLFKK